MERYVTIVNNDLEHGFTAKYDGEYITIPTGGSKVVPYDVMKAWMGDPELIDDGRHNDRSETYDRLCLMYHARGLMGNDPDLLPDIEAFTEDGDKIITVLDDPEGTSLIPDADAPGDIGALQRQIDRLNARLEEKLAGLTDEPGGITEAEDLGARSIANEGAIAEQTAAERAELYGDDLTGTPVTDELVDIPDDAPTQVPVGRPKQSSTPASPARKTPSKRPPSKPRGTAGTAGRRAGTK